MSRFDYTYLKKRKALKNQMMYSQTQVEVRKYIKKITTTFGFPKTTKRR